ncbi:MAG: Sapep family Mn(2+)-dependent dipeptidase [Spirochaetales bacterium]|nr:Sapep family Mn(2+)-dependent dipeptidase [Spirochaetales bacterium]
MHGSVIKYLRDREREIHDDILRLVAIPSVSSDRWGARRALSAFLDMARGFGLETSTAANGDVGIADYDPGVSADAETLGILAHVDVVDPGDRDSWTHEPWGEIAGDAVWGRGTQDDKGPLVMCLHAVRAIAASGARVQKRIRFVVGTMEEVDWEDMRTWLAEPGCKPPDFGFTPDGEFPLVYAENGYCDAWLSFSPGSSGLVGHFKLESLEAGASINSVPDMARATLSGPGVMAAAVLAISSQRDLPGAVVSIEGGVDDRVRLVSGGRAAHSSTPEHGANALYSLCAVLADIGANGLAEFVVKALGSDHRGTALGLQEGAPDPDGELPGPTVVSPDIAIYNADGITLGVNIRTAWGQSLADVEKAFGSVSTRYGYTFRLESFMPAVYVPKDKPFVQALMRAYASVTGKPGQCIRAPGSSYAKALPNHVAFGPIAPDMLDLCHQADERLSFDEIRVCTEIYAEAIASIVLG